MRQAVMWGAGVLLAAGVLAYEPLSSAAVPGASSAVLGASSGYGIDECLANGEPCGTLVATSWCLSNGYKRLIGFHDARADEMTGAPGALVVGESGGAVIIDCGS
jgi:hypothetical protein